MQQAIETRELIVLEGLGVIVRGTYHKAYDKSASPQSNIVERSSIGVLFLNSLSPTRAGTGDSAVYWANAFAEHGYPSFRLDLPGFGDSNGDPPAELLSFINSGGYATIASAKIKELIGRFGLSGVIIVGLCAGAVSALYTAAASAECRGLVLMDPYFHLPLANRSKVWQKLTGRISRSALGRLISNIYDRLKAVQVLLFGDIPPGNANFPLLSRWKDLASTGMPILIFKAPGTKLRGGEFDYFKYILELAGRKSQVVVKVIEGTGHTFSNRAGRAAVRQHTESWLDACFPLIECADSVVATLHLQPDKDQDDCRNHEQCLKG